MERKNGCWFKTWLGNASWTIAGNNCEPSSWSQYCFCLRKSIIKKFLGFKASSSKYRKIKLFSSTANKKCSIVRSSYSCWIKEREKWKGILWRHSFKAGCIKSNVKNGPFETESHFWWLCDHKQWIKNI
jgi:hypothetical protein